jgi:hypothetical protein
MKRQPSKLLLTLLPFTLHLLCAPAFAQTSAFTYQGILSVSNQPANGVFDFQFFLLTSPAGGSQVGPMAAVHDLPVSNGVFTAQLDFGPAAFDGSGRWLEIGVRPGDSTNFFFVLSPRQPVTPAPMALFALNGVPGPQGPVGPQGPPGPPGTTSANGITNGTLADERLSANVALLSAHQAFLGSNRFAGPVALTNLGNILAGNAAGLTNLPPAALAGVLSAGQLPADVVYAAALVAASNALALRMDATNAVQGATNQALQQALLDERNARIAALAAQLSALLAGTNVWTGSNRFAGPVTATNAGSVFQGSFAGSAAGLTNLPPAAIAGVLAPAQVPVLGTANLGPLAVDTAQLKDNAITAAKVAGGELVKRLNGLSDSIVLAAGNGTRLSTAGNTLTLSAGFEWDVPTATVVSAIGNRGFLVTNANARTDFLLPTTIEVGQSIRLRDVGGRGWRLVQSAGQSVRLPNSQSFGGLWTPRETARYWTCLAASSDGSKLAAGFGDTIVLLSTNFGATWIESSTPAQGLKLSASSDGMKLLGANTPSTLCVSTNGGISWSNRQPSRSWSEVLISRDGTRQFATEGNQIHVSSDFFVTAVSNTLPGVLTGRQPRLACSADGTRLVAVGSAALFTSSDGGVLWTSHGLGVTLEVCAMSADGTKMIGLGAGKTFVSTNGGLSFQIVHSDPSKQWSSVAISASGDYALACEATGFIYLSTDFGTTWLPLETSRRWRAVTISDDGTKLAAVETGAPPTPIFTFDTKPQSTAGTAGSLSGGPHSAVELVYAGNGLFVVTGSQGLVTPQ